MSTRFINFPPSGIQVYPTTAQFPATSFQGDQAIAANTLGFYEYDTTLPGWRLTAIPPVSASAIDGLTGDVSASGPGVVPATVNAVGGSTASAVHATVLEVAAAVSTATASTLVIRDGLGGFAGNIIESDNYFIAPTNTAGPVYTFQGLDKGMYVSTGGNLRLKSSVDSIEMDGTVVKSLLPLDMTTHQIHNVVDPTSPQDVVTLAYYNAHLPGTPTLSQVLTAGNDAGAIAMTNLSTLNDASNIVSVDVAGRTLKDSTAVFSIDYGGRSMFAADGSGSLDYSNRFMSDAAGNVSIDWQGRLLEDATSTQSLDFANRILYNSSLVSMLNWSGASLMAGADLLFSGTNNIGSLAGNSPQNVIANNLSITGTGTITTGLANFLITNTIPGFALIGSDNGATVALGSSPGSGFHVLGVYSAADASQAIFWEVDDGDPTRMLLSQVIASTTKTIMTLGASGAQDVEINNNLIVDIQGLFAGGTAGAPGIAGSVDPASGIQLITNEVDFVTGGVVRAYFNTTDLHMRAGLFLESGNVVNMMGATSGTLTQQVPATVTDYTVTYPAAQGGAGTAMINDGAGNLSWGSTAISFPILSPSGTTAYSVSGNTAVGIAMYTSDEIDFNLTGGAHMYLVTTGLNVRTPLNLTNVFGGGMITMAEVATPANPPAGSQTLYIDSTSHKLTRIDSSGTITPIG